ncbi:MAG TPA: nicotinate-nucleotide diphosphorylase (carboxylating), partial [Vicinamibacteria bacterium]|nr:nicotinate-nucleotide diphosphorylase (carboxylating) [Vicinamibacteria bacterium]
MTLDLPDVAALVRRALAEDVGGRDLTTEAVVPPDRTARGVLLAKQELVVSGLDTASATFQALDGAVTFVPRAGEGEGVSAGSILALVSGRARGILTGERVALNFLQRLSGVATLTRRFVEAVA